MLEEELVYNYRLGNMGALSSLFYIYETKTGLFFNKNETLFQIMGYDREDKKEFVRKCVLKSLATFRFGNKSFNTYYSAIAQRYLLNLYRESNYKLESKYMDYSYDLSDYSIQEKISYKEDSESKIDVELILNSIKVYNELDYKIVSYYLQGLSYKEISKQVNIKEKSVCNHLQKIRRNLKKWMIK
jgi:RNA polymerase sigma factor (sigma-70 family)